MVKIDIEGETCSEITEALRGFEELNKTVDAMFSDLARRVFPEVEPASQDATGKDRR
ncbi:MAG: hypothetical protein ABW318_06250 [Vicinamibacterales bacterium]